MEGGAATHDPGPDDHRFGGVTHQQVPFVYSEGQSGAGQRARLVSVETTSPGVANPA
jgi:hypothetical protein